MSEKRFLKPVSLLIASLLSSTLSNQKANAAISGAADKAAKNTELESSEGRPGKDPITLERSADDVVKLDHYSHSSHGSHRSHVSGYN